MCNTRRLACILIASLLASACSKQNGSIPVTEQTNASTAATLPPLEAESANVLRAKLDAGGLPTKYAAYFEDNRIVRIVEHRQTHDATLAGEYTLEGARLLRYQGAKVGAPAELDLQFDLHGALLSGQGPNVSDEDIATIRNRAQLLRSHALAQRATRMHQ